MSQARPTTLVPSTTPWDFVPLPVAVGNRLFIDDRDNEDFKRRLKGLPPDDSPRGPIKFVSIREAAAGVGGHPKTYKKWIKWRLMREAGKPTPAIERTSTIVKKNRPPPAKCEIAWNVVPLEGRFRLES